MMLEAIKYSQYDLLGEEEELLEDRGFFLRLITSVRSNRLKFEVRVPNDLFIRAEVLCDDIIQLRESDKQYTQSELIEHLFTDFLEMVRKHDSNVGAIYNRLRVRKQELPTVKDNPLFPSKSFTTVTTKIHRDDVLRAEVLLKDLSYFEPRHKLDVEEVIEIVYLDFLLEYTKGRRKDVIKEILEYLD